MGFYLTTGVWHAAKKASETKIDSTNEIEAELAAWLGNGGVYGLTAYYIEQAVLKAASDAGQALLRINETLEGHDISDEAALAMNRERLALASLAAWTSGLGAESQLRAALRSEELRKEAKAEANRRRQARHRARKKQAAA